MPEEDKQDALGVITQEPVSQDTGQGTPAINTDVDIGKLSPSGLTLVEQELIKRLEELDEELSGLGDPADDPNVRFDAQRILENAMKDGTVPIGGDIPSDPSDVVAGGQPGETKSGLPPITVLEMIQRKDYHELLPFVGPLYKFGRYIELINAAKTLESGEVQYIEMPDVFVASPGLSPIPATKTRPATQKEMDEAFELVSDWIIELDEQQQRGMTVPARIVSGIFELPAALVEFLVTGPFFKGASVAGKKAAIRVLGRYAERGVGKWAVKLAGAGFGTLARTGVNVPRILEGVSKEMSEGIQITDDGAIVFLETEKPFTVLAKTFTNLYIENISNISGSSIKKGAVVAGKGIGKRFPVINKFTKELADRWIANKPGRTIADFMKTSATKVGYDGMLEELGENRLEDILKVTTGLESPEEILPTWEDLLIEGGVIFVTGAGVNLASLQVSRKGRIKLDIEAEKGKVEDILPEGADPKKIAADTGADAITGHGELSGSRIKKRPKLRDAIARNILRVEDAVSRWGKVGRKVQRDLREISARAHKNIGTINTNIKNILRGTTAADRRVIAQIIDGAVDTRNKPPRLVLRAKRIKEQLDAMQKEAMKVGLRITPLTGRAFPQILNEAGELFLEEAEALGAGSYKVFEWAGKQVKLGRFKTVESAISALRGYRNSRLRSISPYLEGKRTIELDNDMRVWDIEEVLPRVIESGWQAIEAARQWKVDKSGNFVDIKVDIEKLREDVGRDNANMLEDYIKSQFGQSRATEVSLKWSRRLTTAQFIGKLAFSPLSLTRNMLDRFQKGLTLGSPLANVKAIALYPPFLNKWIRTSKKIEEEMIKNGAVIGHGHLMDGLSGEGKAGRFVSRAFASSERGNQTYIALVKKLQLEADIKRLHEMGGDSGTVARMYDRLLTIVGQSQSQIQKRLDIDLTNEQLANILGRGDVSDDIMSEVLHRVVTDSAFPLTLASKRMWFDNRPWVRVIAQFKTWSVDQLRFIYRDVLNYTIETGDPSRLYRFVLATWLVGEMYNISRDFVLNKDESLLSTLTDEDGRNFKDISRSIMNAMADGGLVGMFADLVYGVTDWTGGPTLNSIKNATETGIAVAVDPATTADGLKMFLLEDIPALRQARGVLDRIDREFFDENNLTENYSKWRRRSFEFREKKDQLTPFERKGIQILLGARERRPGVRSLSLEMISRQILVGDIEDAADYIVGIYKDTRPDKLKDLGASIRQSAINHSPLGNIRKKDIEQFLSQFSKEGRDEIKALQVKWLTSYDKAYKLALKQLEDEDFIGRLREKMLEELAVVK